MHDTLSDWLKLHGFELEQCRTLLQTALDEQLKHEVPNTNNITDDVVWDIEDAWQEVFRAFSSAFLLAKPRIQETFRFSKKIHGNAAERLGKSFTIETADEDFPVICVPFSGRSSEVLTLAHEFGHALQLVECKGEFCPPVLRETCAFLAELVFIQHIVDSKFADVSDWCAIHRANNHKYILQDGHKLLEALADSNGVYDYSWNYPLARYLAAKIFAAWSFEQIWSVLRNDQSLEQLIIKL